MGPLPVIDKGIKYILVVSDVFSKWVEAFPMQVTDGFSLTSILMDEVICRYGVPTQLHSDQGSNLNAEVNQKLASCLEFYAPELQLTTHREMGKWNVLTALWKLCWLRWWESITEIGINICKRLYLHTGHHFMTRQGLTISG